jgi:hypothetical protein
VTCGTMSSILGTKLECVIEDVHRGVLGSLLRVYLEASRELT